MPSKHELLQRLEDTYHEIGELLGLEPVEDDEDDDVEDADDDEES